MSRAKKKKELSETEKLQALGWLLSDSIYDLCVPAEIFTDYLHHYENRPPNEMLEGVVRMCRFSIVMAMCKLEEALKDYGKTYKDAPVELLGRIKRLRKHIQEKDYRTLRSKFVAHTFDSFGTHTYEDGQHIAEGIYGNTLGDLKVYFDWIKPPKDLVELQIESPVWIAYDLKEYVRTRVSLPPRISLR